LKDYLQLNGEILYWLFIGSWKEQLFKVSHIFNQAVRIGVEALPMVALTAFSIGLTLAMQGAHELQRMGAALYVPNLVSMSLLRELGPLLIAIIVIGCSLILLAALTVAISGQPWGARGRKLEIEFKDATSIKLHSPVRYAGAVAGSVAAIRYLTLAERKQPGKRDLAVRVTVRLDKGVPALPSDVTASISSETILGEKFVALSAGSPDVKPPPEGAVIEGQSLSGIETLTQTAEKTATAATAILQTLNGDYPELKTNLNRLLVSGDTLLVTATNLVNDAQTVMADVRGTLHQVEETVVGVRPQVSNLLTKATSVATNLDGTIDNTRAITAEVREFLTNQFLANLD
jgi:ABC-type transporter Mla subunit MlaD